MDFKYPWHYRFCRCLDGWLPARFREHPFTLLEIGVLEAGGASHAISNYRVSRYVGVDPWQPYQDIQQWDEDDAEACYQRAKVNLAAANSNGYTEVFLLRQPSSLALPALRPGPFRFDLIYVDGDHFARQVEEDGRNAWPLLSRQGCMVFDDCQDERIREAVRRVLEPLEGRYETVYHSRIQWCVKRLS